jgi:hypothetical protein
VPARNRVRILESFRRAQRLGPSTAVERVGVRVHESVCAFVGRGGVPQHCRDGPVTVLEANDVAFRRREDQAQSAQRHLVEMRAESPERRAVAKRERHAPPNEMCGLAGRVALEKLRAVATHRSRITGACRELHEMNEGWSERVVDCDGSAERGRRSLEGRRQPDRRPEMQIVIAQSVPHFGVIGVGVRRLLGGARQHRIRRIPISHRVGSADARQEDESSALRKAVLVAPREPHAALNA